MNYMTRMRAEPTTPPASSDLADLVCWSRMQSEAGQGLDAIIARKETERLAGDGVFLWGVGNAPAVAIRTLARAGCTVPAIFSVMKSRPKTMDAAPNRTFAWRSFVDAHGVTRELPAHAIVTSRGDSAGGPKRHHYALMCFSPRPLALECGTAFDVSAYRNVGGTGAPVGASQVTALLRRSAEPSRPSSYEVNLRAWLTGDLWVRLTDPVLVAPELTALLDAACPRRRADWIALSQRIRAGQPPRHFRTNEDLLL
jgi:hypothetical protein